MHANKFTAELATSYGDDNYVEPNIIKTLFSQKLIVAYSSVRANRKNVLHTLLLGSQH